MEKILLAVDAINPDDKSLAFACYIARLTHSKITGVFLENLVADERPVLKYAATTPYFDWSMDQSSVEYQVKRELIEKNIARFKEKCQVEEVPCVVHRDRGVPINELISESRFADIIIIDPETSFNKRYESNPTEFVREILKQTECPVMISPEIFDGVDSILFAYNGSSSSVFAIKQFTYLFPQLRETKVTVINVNEKAEWADPDKYVFAEWLKQHYSHVHFAALQGDADTALFDYLLRKQNTWIVLGAYGRSDVSRFFKHSRADLLIKGITQPIFIAHK